MTAVNFFDMDREELIEFLVAAGHRPFRAKQLQKWVYHQGITDFSAMTDLSKAMRAWLAEAVTFDLPEVQHVAHSTDGTIKWVVKVQGGNCVETVLIPDHTAERKRNTLCVSSQVGCTLDCTFCSTGKQGFDGNLSTAEIIGQVLIANAALAGRGEAVTNIVFMGMGEPLLNYEPVMRAARLLMADDAFGLSKRRVTVSTAGVVPKIREMTGTTDVSLAISLHAPNDALRDQLVPLNKKYNIRELMDACNAYVEGLGEKRSLTIEYTLMDRVNDGLEHAAELAELLRDVRCKINLIPFNPFPGSGFKRPSMNRVRRFQTALMQQGYATMLRTTRGDDIDAACGQLVGRVADRTRRQDRYRSTIEAGGTAAQRRLRSGDKADKLVDVKEISV